MESPTIGTSLEFLAQPGNDSTVSPQPAELQVSSQVCDRCPKKSAAMDFYQPCCQTANATCTFSKKLKRRTKPRRHVEQQDKIIENLKIQNEKLKQQLEQVIAINSKPGNPGGSTLGANVPRSPHFAQAQLLPFTLGSGTSDTLQESEQPIIKHLGRLVSSSSAQSLGLHRHARRFTFCRGDVELRKRVWWCVYAVDIASSIVHGLPKVIQDDDVDNDLPVDADLEDCTATEIPLPLPGESTNFGIFITYIKLLRIMSTCLKTLYTTTKRRNGVAKITALDQELSVWRNSIGNFKDRDTASEHEKGIVEDVYANSSYHAFEIPFLHLLSNVCMLLIHLPALTFEPAHPQFAKSLGSSVRAGLNILIILSRNHSNRRVDCLLPNRESLAFQSALVCFYHQWVSRVSSLPSMLDINISLEKVTGAAIELLNAQKTELVQMDTSPAREIDHTTLSTTIEFIESLCSRTKQLFHDYTPTPIPPTQQQAPSFLQEQFNPFSDFGNEADDIAGLGALGELNQLEFAWDDGLFNFETE
ncbi:hypothetical protein MW887_010823 [Aspergillus wentii]|nr:hypothetical protein MW887_010823 [Aspergillus wentii]